MDHKMGLIKSAIIRLRANAYGGGPSGLTPSTLHRPIARPRAMRYDTFD